MGKNILVWTVAIIILAAGAFILLGNPKSGAPTGDKPSSDKSGGNQQKQDQKPAVELSPLSASYILEGQVVTLKNGKEEKQITAEGEKQITEVWGTPVGGDLNSDGQSDYALIITQKTTGDVGIYYYVAAALVDQKNGVIAGANAVPLGDRIDMKDISIVSGAIRVNYGDPKYIGDATTPSGTTPVTKTFALDGVLLRGLFQKQANAKAEAACTDSGGAWDKKAITCKGLTKDWCAKNAGEFKNNLCQF